MRRVALTGIKPLGSPHIGNYQGAKKARTIATTMMEKIRKAVGIKVDAM